MSFSSVCKNIKSLKIQGAINVAKEGVKALFEFSKSLKDKEVKVRITKIKEAAEKLVSLRQTEPALRNSVNFMISNLHATSNELLNKEIEKRYNEIIIHFDESEKKIIEYGVRKIMDGYVVFTHCHSSTVVKILKEAKSRGIKFEVHNTETRPLYQGRKTATELSKAGIPIVHYVDSAARHAMKKADIVLLGADAITTTKIYNKVGSEMFAILAETKDIPVYCCTDSWKFDPYSVIGFDEIIEKRNSKEIWPNCPKKIKIHNYAFDKVSPKLITAIISELGVYDHSRFIDEVQKKIKAN
jgi:ribose 1,5-bisphosphate isomerase